MTPPADRAARLQHPAAQVILRLIAVYAKRAANAYAVSSGTGPTWDAYYGLACTEEALRHTLWGYVQLERLDLDDLRNERLHAGSGAATVAECKRAAGALEAALRKAGLDVRGEPVRAE